MAKLKIKSLRPSLVMPTNKAHQDLLRARLVGIIEILRNSTFAVTCGEIRRALVARRGLEGKIAVCENTISKDIMLLKQKLHAPIEFNRHENSYILNPRNYELPQPLVMPLIMPLDKDRQDLRWARLVGIIEILRNNTISVTCGEIRRVLAEHRGLEEDDEEASEATIRRDIKLLKKKYHAPIEFNHGNNSYGMDPRTYELPVVELGDAPVAPTQMANAIARQVLPPNLVTSLNTMEDTIKAVAPAGKLADPKLLNAILIASGRNVELNENLCQAIIRAWQESRRISIRQRAGARIEELEIEPHALFFTEGAWYARAHCRNMRTEGRARPFWRSLPLHRLELVDAKPLGEAFTRKQSVLDDLRNGRLFHYDTIKEVRVTCHDQKTVEYIRERAWFPEQRITVKPDGELELTVPEVSLPHMAAWVLQFGGTVVAQAPVELQNAVLDAAAKLLAAHTPPDKKTVRSKRK